MRKLKMRFGDFVSEAALSNTRNSQRIKKLLKTSRGTPEVIEKYQEAFDSLKLGLKMIPKTKNYVDKEHIENRLKALKSARRYLESDGHTVQARAEDIEFINQIINLYNAGKIEGRTEFITKSNEIVELEKEDFENMLAIMVKNKMKFFKECRLIKDTIESQNTVNEVQSIRWGL